MAVRRKALTAQWTARMKPRPFVVCCCLKFCTGTRQQHLGQHQSLAQNTGRHRTGTQRQKGTNGTQQKCTGTSEFNRNQQWNTSAAMITKNCKSDVFLGNNNNSRWACKSQQVIPQRIVRSETESWENQNIASAIDSSSWNDWSCTPLVINVILNTSVLIKPPDLCLFVKNAYFQKLTRISQCVVAPLIVPIVCYALYLNPEYLLHLSRLLFSWSPVLFLACFCHCCSSSTRVFCLSRIFVQILRLKRQPIRICSIFTALRVFTAAKSSLPSLCWNRSWKNQSRNWRCMKIVRIKVHPSFFFVFVVRLFGCCLLLVVAVVFILSFFRFLWFCSIFVGFCCSVVGCCHGCCLLCCCCCFAALTAWILLTV